MSITLPVLRPIQFKSPGDVLLFRKRLKALPNNPVDAYIDWIYLPDPAVIRLPFALTNQQGGDRYVQTRLLNPPAGWTDTPNQHGSVANGATLRTNHVTQRAKPTFTAGEYNETITLLVQLYRDANYTDLDLELSVEYNLHHFASNDPAWTLLDFDDFEVDNELWKIPVSSPNRKWSLGGSVGYAKRLTTEGYASSCSLIGMDTSDGKGNFDYMSVCFGNFNSTGDYIAETSDEYLKSYPTMPKDVWIVFFGAFRLDKTYIGIAYWFDHTNAWKVMAKYWSKPSAAKCYASGVTKWSISQATWLLDRVRVVYK